MPRSPKNSGRFTRYNAPARVLRGSREVDGMEQDVGAAERELGFLLIADMEGSTQSKFLLGEEGAFAALREHNRLIMEQCRKAAPTPGVVLNSLGDAVVAKFPSQIPRPGGRALEATGTLELPRRGPSDPILLRSAAPGPRPR
jgi:class 3 adenylate cyclase